MPAHVTSARGDAEENWTSSSAEDVLVRELNRDLSAALEGVPVQNRVGAGPPARIQVRGMITRLLNISFRGNVNEGNKLAGEIELLVSSARLDVPAEFEAALLHSQGLLSSAQLDFESAARYQMSALRLARLSGNQNLVVACQLQSARNNYQQGNLIDSIEGLAAVTARTDLSSYNLAVFYGLVAELCAHYRLWQSVEPYLAQSLDLNPGLGEISRARHLSAYASALVLTGDLGAARRSIEALHQMDEVKLNPTLLALVDSTDAGLRSLSGDDAAALRLSAESVEVIESSGDTYHLMRVRRGRAMVLAKLGRYDEALSELAKTDYLTMGSWGRRAPLELSLYIAQGRGCWRYAVGFQKQLRDHDRELRRTLARMYSLMSRYRHDQDLLQTRRALEETNEGLRLARTERDRLLHIVAHDLKSPLAALDLTLDFIAREANDGLSVEGRIGSATKIAGRVQKIASQLGALHDLESDTFSVSEENLDVERLLGQILSEYELYARTKRISIELQVKSPRSRPVVVRADADRLLQVFDNLVSNALKYSYIGGRVSVVVTDVLGDVGSAQPSMVEIKFVDSGQGLSEQDGRMLFGKYSRLSARPTAGETSSGIGLYIAHSFARAMGGSLDAESEGKGRGSVFRLLMPSSRSAGSAGDDVLDS